MKKDPEVCISLFVFNFSHLGCSKITPLFFLILSSENRDLLNSACPLGTSLAAQDGSRLPLLSTAMAGSYTHPLGSLPGVPRATAGAMNEIRFSSAGRLQRAAPLASSSGARWRKRHQTPYSRRTARKVGQSERTPRPTVPPISPLPLLHVGSAKLRGPTRSRYACGRSPPPSSPSGPTTRWALRTLESSRPGPARPVTPPPPLTSRGRSATGAPRAHAHCRYPPPPPRARRRVPGGGPPPLRPQHTRTHTHLPTIESGGQSGSLPP